MNITCGHVHYEYTFSFTIKERQSFEIDLTSRATGQTKAQQTLVRINGCEPIISDMSWNEKFSQKFAKFCCHLWKVADSIDPHKADDLPKSDPNHRKACPIRVHQVEHIPWKGSTWNGQEFGFSLLKNILRLFVALTGRRTRHKEVQEGSRKDIPGRSVSPGNRKSG